MRSIYKQECINQIEKKLNWGDSDEWTQRHFNNLSKKIQDHAGILISPQTLKRFFGKISTADDYLPQEATLSALASFLGYKNWTTFEDAVDKNPPLLTEVKIEKTKREKSKTNQKFTIRRFYIPVAIIILIGIILMLKNPILDFVFPPKASIETQVSEGKAPLSVIYKYEIKNVRKGHQFTINFGGENKNNILNPDNNTITQYYPYPNLYQTKILYKDKVIGEKNILVSSDQWLVNIDKQSGRNIYYYHSLKNGMLSVTNQDFIKYEIDSNKYFQTSYSMFKDFGLSADDMRFETRLKNNRVLSDEFYCNFTILTFNGEFGNINIKLTDTKCFNKSSFRIADQNIEGATTDLSVLGYDINDFINISLNIRNKKAKLYINNKMIFETSYTKKIGKLYGVKILFNTTGDIDNINLYKGDELLIYSDDFLGK